MLQTPNAVLFVEMDDNLRVCGRTKSVPAFEKSFAQFDIIVDFTIEHNPDSCVLIAHGLSAAIAQVNDRKPPVPQPDGPRTVRALAVRPTMNDPVQHPLD